MSFTQAQIDAEIEAQLITGSDITALQLRGVLHDMNAAGFQGVPPPSAPFGSVLSAITPSNYNWTTTPALGANGAVGGSLQLFGSTSGSITLAPTTAGSTLTISQDGFGTMLQITGPGATIANQVQMLAATTGNAATIQAVGTDTNVNLAFDTQGSGAVLFISPSTALSASILNGIQVGTPTGGDKGLGTLNSASTIYVNNDPVEAAHRITGTVGVSGTTSFSASIPPNASVIGITVFTTTAFAASGTVTLSAGSAAGDNAYVAAQNIQSLGVYKLLLNGFAAQNQGSLPNTSPNYFITITQTGTPSNVGAATILIHYVST